MAEPKTAKCVICGEPDSLKAGQYRGPWGHFLRDQKTGDIYEGWDCCYDCWTCEWFLSPDTWPDKQDYLLALIYANTTQVAIAQRLGVSRRTVQTWFSRLRKKPQIILDWVAQFGHLVMGTIQEGDIEECDNPPDNR